MKHKHLFLLMLAVTVISNGSFAQSAKEIVDNHIKAIGGLEKSQNEKSIHSIGTFEGNIGKGKIEMYSISNKGFRVDLTKEDSTVSTNILYDHYRWSESADRGATKPQKLPDAVWESMDLDLSGEVVEYEKKGNTAEYAGKDSVDGKECYKIKITKQSGRVTYYFFDTKTYYILQSTVITMKDGKEIEGNISRFGDYRKTAFGLVKPFLLMQILNGKVMMTTRNTVIEINKPFIEKMFVMPAN